MFVNTSFTIQLDAEVLASAEQEARARHTTLAEILSRYLKVMAVNWQQAHEGRTPVTDSLRGAIDLPPDADPVDRVTQKLREKYGD